MVFFRHLDRISVVLYFLKLRHILFRNFKPLETHSRSTQFEFALTHPKARASSHFLLINISPSLGLAMTAASQRFTYSPLHIQTHTHTHTDTQKHTHTHTYRHTHTHTHPHITKQYKTTTVQIKTNTVQDIPK